MKKILILITFISSLLITKSIGETTDLAVDVDSGKIWVYSVNRSTGATTLLNSNAIDGGSVSFGASYLDSEGNMYFKGQSNYLIYNYSSNTFTGTRPLVTGTAGGSATIFELRNIDSNGNTIITTGTDAVDGSSTTILGSLDISDSNGNTLIENKADGSVHIGENSLVTQEVNGVQQLYATNSAGNQIDLNIKSGTNLLIGGRNIMDIIGGDISGSVALSSALAALPNSSPDAFYTCSGRSAAW